MTFLLLRVGWGAWLSCQIFSYMLKIKDFKKYLPKQNNSVMKQIKMKIRSKTELK